MTYQWNRTCDDCDVNISWMPSIFRYCTDCASGHTTEWNTSCYHCWSSVDSENHSLCHDCFFKRCVDCWQRTKNPAFDYCISCYPNNRTNNKWNLEDQIINKLLMKYNKETAKNWTPFFRTSEWLIFVNHDGIVVSSDWEKEDYTFEAFERLY